MDIEEIRKYLLDCVNSADERLLKVLKAVVEDAVVAYTIGGKPLSKLEYKRELTQTLGNLKIGELISQEELETETENWL